MFKHLILLTIMVTFAVVLTATEVTYLISVDTTDMVDRTILKEFDLQIYHISGNTLIAGLTNLKRISNTDIPYSIIDQEAWSEKYYLISNMRGKEIEIEPGWGKEIYRDDYLVILKTSALSIEQITSIPYSITEMLPIPVNYRYERVYPSLRTEMPSTRTDVNDLLAEISPDSLAYFIQSMEGFGTRYCFAPNRDQVANWIKDEFLRFGFTDVVIDSFYQSNVWHKNVVATLPGILNPDQIVIIGGHHDSISSGNPMLLAPGADDNASGSGAAMEIARAMKAVNYQPEITIRFITFAAEEVGLWGSHHYALDAYNEGMNIKIMLNNDMIGHTTQNPSNWTIHLIEYNGFENEANFSRQVMQQFTTMTPVTYTYNSASSDSYPFWTRGFPPIFFIETNFNPYYHTVNDLFIYLNMDYAIETVKATAAIAVLINSVPDIPENFVAIDAGNGSDLILEWDPVNSTVIDHYQISVGMSSGNYIAHYETEESTFTLFGLEEGVTYYIGLSAIGASGYDSAIVEVTGTPLSVPMTPVNLDDAPTASSIVLSWAANMEADLAGYKLYRSEVSGELGEPVHQGVITENSFSDTDIVAGVYYYYAISAVDESDNESDPSEQVRSRMVSMDQGVLILADTPNGNGSFQNPTLTSITQFYNQILTGYYPDIYPLWPQNRLKLADLGAYSTVVWHRNNPAIMPYSTEIINAIKQYLDLGGNILFSVYYPGSIFSASNGYPSQFTAGQFIYDYLKISQVDLNSSARFITAQPLAPDYPIMTVDDDKAPAGLNYHIFNIESIVPAPDGGGIYSYLSDYPAGSPEAAMDGLPVGVEYIGDDYKTIVLSFPLYYMEQQDARELISYVMSEKFYEPVSAEEEITLPVGDKKYQLYANYPNPFNPETVIRYSLKSSSPVNLTVYNLKGQRVRELVNETRERGDHFVVWNGKDDAYRDTASGIYFYKLSTEFGQDNRKMLLMK